MSDFGTGRRDGLRLSLDGLNAPSSSSRRLTAGVRVGGGGGVPPPPMTVPTITTPTVTPSPSSLRNIEQIFIMGQQESGDSNGPSSETHEHAARFVPPSLLVSGGGGEGGGGNSSLAVTPSAIPADLSTPTIANVILDMTMNNGDDEEAMINRPTTVGDVMKQLQESESTLNSQHHQPPNTLTTMSLQPVKEEPPPPPMPPLTRPNRPTSLSLTVPPMASGATSRKRKSLQSVIQQLSPAASAVGAAGKTSLPALFAASSTADQAPASSASSSTNASRLKPEVIERLLHPHASHDVPVSPLHSLASVSAIQNPLPVDRPSTSIIDRLPLPSFGGTSGGGIVGTDRPVNLSKTPDADYPPTQLLPPPTLTELPTQIQTAAQSQSVHHQPPVLSKPQPPVNNIHLLLSAASQQSSLMMTAVTAAAAANEVKTEPQIAPPVDRYENDQDAAAHNHQILPPPPSLVPADTARRKIKRHPSEESVADPYLDPNVLSKLPEGERKKILRRQRNKEAAARCRKRRLDQTVSLEDQVQEWETRLDELKREITSLSAQESGLVAILQAHRAHCKVVGTPVYTQGPTKTPSGGKKSKQSRDNDANGGHS